MKILFLILSWPMLAASPTRTTLGTATQAAGTTCTIASITLAANDVIVAGIVNNTGTNAFTFTWNSNTFLNTGAGTSQAGIAGGINYAGITPYTGFTAGTGSLVISWASSGKASCWADKLQNVAVDRASAPANAFQSGTGSSATPSSGATPTTTYPIQIAIANIANTTTSGVGGSWSNSFTDGQSLATNISIDEGFLQLTTTQAVTAAKTGATNAAWIATVMTFVAPRRIPIHAFGLLDIILWPFLFEPEWELGRARR